MRVERIQVRQKHKQVSLERYPLNQKYKQVSFERNLLRQKHKHVSLENNPLKQNHKQVSLERDYKEGPNQCVFRPNQNLCYSDATEFLSVGVYQKGPMAQKVQYKRRF